jgi:predicted GNAT family acetyltransferase
MYLPGIVLSDLRVERPASIPDFYAEVRDYLLEHEAEHGLMLSVASATLVAPAESWWSLARTQDGQVVAAALRTTPKLMLSRERTPGAVAALADDARQATFDSIIGPWPSLESFAAAFGGTWRPTHRHVLYECRAVHASLAPPGERVVVAPPDRSLIADWIQAFSAEAIGDGATRDAAEMLVDRHLRDRSMWVWRVDDEPVACAAAVGRTPHGIRLNAVYTPPERRRRGYASALVGSITRELLETGRDFVFLYADARNPTANAIYRRIGYRQIGEAGELVLESR